MDMFSKLAFSGTENLVICKKKKSHLEKAWEERPSKAMSPRAEPYTAASCPGGPLGVI